MMHHSSSPSFASRGLVPRETLSAFAQRRFESSSAAASTSTSSSSSSPTAAAPQQSPLASFLARARRRGGLISAPASPSLSLSASSSPEGFASRQRVLRLRAEAAWARWGRVAGLTAGGAAALLLWRGVRAVSGKKEEKEKKRPYANELKAAAASLAAVAAALALARRRLSASPQQVHAAAMRRLSANPAVVEVLGAPLVSPPAAAPRAAVESGGGVRFRSLATAEQQQQQRNKKKRVLPFLLFPLVLPRPAWRPRRVQTVFAVEGSQRRALASVDAKKEGGELVFKVLALDIPVVVTERASSSFSMQWAADGEESTTTAQRRMFLEGDEATFSRGGVLPALRSALVNSAAARASFDAADDVDAAAEESRRNALLRAADALKLAEAERRLRKAVVVEGEGEREGGKEADGEEAEAADHSPRPPAPAPPQPWWRRVFSSRPLIV